MVQLKYLLFLYFIGVVVCCCNAGENDSITLIGKHRGQSSPRRGRNIVDVFPNEIMDQFLFKMDLLTLTKAASSSRYMVNLRILRKRFVEAITKFRKVLKGFAPGSNLHKLIIGFKMIIDACRRADNEPDLVNSLRFIFLCKFIASLRPIDNPKWQNPINFHLSSVMSGHVEALLEQGKNENVKKFVLALSVYDYNAYSRFLAEQALSPSSKALMYGFIMLIENSGDHMENRLPVAVFSAYNGYRQNVNSYEVTDDFNHSADKSKFTFNLKFELNHKLRKGDQTINDLIDCHVLYIETMKTVISLNINGNYPKRDAEFFDHLIIMLFCGIQELLQFKKRSSELIRKANINLAIFELVGNSNDFIQLLAESLRKIQMEAKTVKTSLSHQLQHIDRFINKINIKGDEDCYLELLIPVPVQGSEKLTKAQLYIKEVEAAMQNAISNILKSNGLKKYREALEIFRNMGSDLSSLIEIRMNLYYAYHTAIFIPEILSDKNLSELVDIEQLHAETFQALQPSTLKTTKTKIYNFQNLLNDFLSEFGSNLTVSKDANEKKENRIKQRLLLKSALLFANEVYGIDFPGTGSARYITIREQSTDDGAAARQQMLAIIKFFYASVSYNSDEIGKDPHLILEYSSFSQSFTTDIKALYMHNEDEEFYFLHNQIDEQSPASNSMVYITQLHTLFEIYIASRQRNLIPLPTCLLRNIFYFQTKLNLKIDDNTLTQAFLYPAYKLYSEEFVEMARENGELKVFIDISLDWILNNYYSTEPAFSSSKGPLNLLKSIFGAIEKISNAEEAERMLTKELILRLDHVAFGCSCEYSAAFGNSLQSIYKAFRLEFEFEVKPRKLANM